MNRTLFGVICLVTQLGVNFVFAASEYTESEAATKNYLLDGGNELSSSLASNKKSDDDTDSSDDDDKKKGKKDGKLFCAKCYPLDNVVSGCDGSDPCASCDKLKKNGPKCGSGVNRDSKKIPCSCLDENKNVIAENKYDPSKLSGISN